MDLVVAVKNAYNYNVYQYIYIYIRTRYIDLWLAESTYVSCVCYKALIMAIVWPLYQNNKWKQGFALSCILIMFVCLFDGF